MYDRASETEIIPPSWLFPKYMLYSTQKVQSYRFVMVWIQI